MNKRTFFSVLIVLCLVPGLAEALSCNSLWSLRSGGGVFCDDAGLDGLYQNPTVAAEGSGPLLGLFAPQCANGTNSCLGDEVRCMDGTRPIYYVDPAEDANGDPLITNNWLFWTTGGGTCIDGQACGRQYLTGDRSGMTSASATRFRQEEGIFSSDSRNLFRHYNRVYLRKCTSDRFSGTKTHNALVVSGSGDAVDLFTHGRFMWQAVFNDLVTTHPTIGKKYDTSPCPGLDCDNSCPPGSTTCEWLPNLANATKVLLIGWSGGATGLINQVDSLAPELQALAPNADIRAVFDGRFNPSLDVQASFWADIAPTDGVNDYTQCAGVISPSCIDADLDGRISHGESLNAPRGTFSGLFNEPGELPFNPACPACGLGYSIFHFQVGERSWQTHDFLGYQLDTSCEAVHGVDAPQCLEPMHVLMNHVATPHFIRVALEDSTYWGTGGTASGADDSNYAYQQGPLGARTRTQAVQWTQSFATDSELALGIDDSWSGVAGVPSPPPFAPAIFAPAGTSHAGTIANPSFFNTCLLPPGGGVGDELSLHTALYEWATFDVPRDAVQSAATGWSPVVCP